MSRRKLPLKLKLKILLLSATIFGISFGLTVLVGLAAFRAMTDTRTTLAAVTYSRDVPQIASRGVVQGGQAGSDRGLAISLASLPRAIIVTPGDTLWDIANRYYPNVDARKVVWALKVANGLVDGGTLVPGMRVRLPREIR